MSIDPRKFLFHSDYASDTVLAFFEGTVSATLQPYETKTISVAHKLPFTPLVGGYWSTDAGFSTAYDFVFNAYLGPTAPGVQVECTTDANNLNFHITAPYSDGSTSEAYIIYYKIYCFAPADFTGSFTPKYSTYRDKFIFNTDYNYMKLYKNEMAALDSKQSAVINHNLGYVPAVDVWVDYGGGVHQLGADEVGSIHGSALSPVAEVNSTSLILRSPESLNTKFYYRIYYDEA